MSEEKLNIKLEDRNLYITGEIKESNITPIIKKIKEINIYDINRKTVEPIHLFINSVGGCVYSKFDIINTINSSTTPIHTYNTSICFSAAFSIFIVGHKRFSYNNSLFMFHGMLCGLGVDSVQQHKEDLKDWLDQLTKFNIDLITNKTLLTKKQLNLAVLNKKCLYFNSNEALKLKITDKILN